MRCVSKMPVAKPDPRWEQKQRASAPTRYYGDGGTIHRTSYLDVETTAEGTVVAVWFRCARLPFLQHTVSEERAKEMLDSHREVSGYSSTGVESFDPKGAKA